MGKQGQGWGRIQAEGTAEQMSVGGNVECSRHVQEQQVACWARGQCVQYKGPDPAGTALCLQARWGRSKAR